MSKALASAVSIGSGFRGGLFYASLFMGALLGSLFAGIVQVMAPWLQPSPHVFAIIGMSSMAVSVVGGPLTMLFLALETTGNFALALPLIAAVLVAALTARRLSATRSPPGASTCAARRSGARRMSAGSAISRSGG